MSRIPRWSCFLPLSLAALAIAGCGSQSSAQTPATQSVAANTKPARTPVVPPTPVVTGSVAAIVNGHSIPLSTYRLLLNLAQRTSNGQQPVKTLAQQTMQEVIFNELIREFAAGKHIVVTDKEVAAQEAKDEKQVGGQHAFVQRLSQLGLSLSDYRTLVRPNLLAQKVEQVIAPIKPARSDAAAHALALQLLHQLQHGANFATLARKYSEDPGSATQGGDLGTVYQGQMVPPFDKASFHAPIGKYVLVHSQYGWHIVQVLSRGKGAPPGQPKAKKVPTAHVRHILISTQPQGQQAQQSKFVAWLHKLEAKAKIKQVAKVKS